MKTYLDEFFKNGGYAPADAAYLSEISKRIDENPTAADRFLKAAAEYAKATCDYAQLIALADEAAGCLQVHEYTVELLLFIRLSEQLRERYRERGIDEAIFWDSMLDLRYKLEECKAVKGVCGSFVASWFEGFFNLTRFAFGRLQFEVIPFGQTYEKDGKRLMPDSKVINIHIPRTGTPLTPAEVDSACKQAADFYADQLEEHTAFVCYSWLLYPELETVLPDHSNIVKFLKRFDVFMWGVDKNKTDLWRMFDTDESHPDRLPTDSSMRRAIVAHIKSGGKLGRGYGVFFID